MIMIIIPVVSPNIHVIITLPIALLSYFLILFGSKALALNDLIAMKESFLGK